DCTQMCLFCWRFQGFGSTLPEVPDEPVEVLEGKTNTNLFHHNGFKDNNGTGWQVWDRGTNEKWYREYEGNWWSDYKDKFPNATVRGNVWDTPYLGDRYPLVHFEALEDTEPPEADAGEDMTVDQRTLVRFSGLNSTDDDKITGYVWRFRYGDENITLLGPTPEFHFHMAGTYHVVLNVTDAAGNWDTDHVMVHVRDTERPWADIGVLPLMTYQHEPVTLDGRGSSDNVEVVNWTWTFTHAGDEVVLYGPVVEFTFHVAEVHMINLTVRDAAGNEDTIIELIDIRDRDRPIARAGEDLTVGMGETFTLSDNGSTDNQGIAEFQWTLVHAGEQVWLDGAEVNYVIWEPGEYEVTLWVTDINGIKGSDTITVHVLDTEPPYAFAGPDRIVDQGDTVVFDGSNCTDNIGIVRYEWSYRHMGFGNSWGGVRVERVFEEPAVYTIQLRVYDAQGNEGFDSFKLTVRDTEPPVADPGPARTIDMDATFRLNAGGSRDNVRVTNYTWSFEYDGRTVRLYDRVEDFTFRIPGAYRITLTVEDAAGNHGISHLNLTVRDTMPPVAPVIYLDEVRSGERVTLDGSEARDNVAVVRWVWTFNDGGELVTLEGERVEYTFNNPGTIEVDLTVYDAEGNSDTSDLLVTVRDTQMVTLGMIAAILVIAIIGAVLYMSWYLPRKRDRLVWRKDGKE
ncbi:MAG: PKD domain-containing protein, partial [Thermoplasmata archaeon]